MLVESEFLMLEKKNPKKTQYIQALQFYTCFFFSSRITNSGSVDCDFTPYIWSYLLNSL